jgi:hypothetical protein
MKVSAESQWSPAAAEVSGAALSAGLAEWGGLVVVADLDPKRTGQVATAVGGIVVAGDASRVEV